MQRDHGESSLSISESSEIRGREGFRRLKIAEGTMVERGFVKIKGISKGFRQVFYSNIEFWVSMTSGFS